MSRTEIPVDWDEVDELIRAGCNAIQVAGVLRMHPDTLHDKVRTHHNTSFTLYSHGKKEAGEGELMRAQHQLALEKNATMLMHLGKCRLRQGEDPRNAISPNDVLLEQSAEIIRLKYENSDLRTRNANESEADSELLGIEPQI